MSEVTNMEGVLLRLAQHLASNEVDGGGFCHIVCSTGERCGEPDAAIRWEYGFADIVCERHAQAARNRGALVVYPALNDGTTTALDPVRTGGLADDVHVTQPHPSPTHQPTEETPA